ncbi:MAG TPA: response regulator [Gammaproteobacteria bacterium]|nr:response regulator [Gammaproteobacteria bacterium]
MAVILAADDSESFHSTIEYTLVNKGGHQLEQAENGSAALKKIEQYRNNMGKSYDLILADVNMPVMGGFEMVEEIRRMADYRLTPIIFLTTQNSDEAKQRGRDLKATGWITKPFSPEVAAGCGCTCTGVSDQLFLRAQFNEHKLCSELP